jgi:hypothetical protein
MWLNRPTSYEETSGAVAMSRHGHGVLGIAADATVPADEVIE